MESQKYRYHSVTEFRFLGLLLRFTTLSAIFPTRNVMSPTNIAQYYNRVFFAFIRNIKGSLAYFYMIVFSWIFCVFPRVRLSGNNISGS